MPLESKHISKFLENSVNDKDILEILNLLTNRINKLCFEECQIDRIACTLTPLCTRRFLLKIRIKNGLNQDDLPKFCYSVQKNIVLRHFWGKTVVYRPVDAYLYLIDFLDIFFHGDYRKLNKFISFQDWDDFKKLLDKRIHTEGNFIYFITENNNYLIFKFDDKLHIVFNKEKYALCNANRENIVNLDILYGICELYRKMYFTEFRLRKIRNEFVDVTAIIPRDVISMINTNIESKENFSALDNYFWNDLSKDLEGMMQICQRIRMRVNPYNNNLLIRLRLNLETNFYNENGKPMLLRYRDLKLVFTFISRIYNEYYVYWIK